MGAALRIHRIAARGRRALVIVIAVIDVGGVSPVKSPIGLSFAQAPQCSKLNVFVASSTK